MRKLAYLFPLALLLGACGTFTWEGRNPGLSEEERSMGLKDVATLSREYDSELYWRRVRQKMDGRTNALGRDLGSIAATLDRHVFNYSPTDPYVNFETEENYFSTALSQGGSMVGVNTLPWFPVR